MGVRVPETPVLHRRSTFLTHDILHHTFLLVTHKSQLLGNQYHQPFFTLVIAVGNGQNPETYGDSKVKHTRSSITPEVWVFPQTITVGGCRWVCMCEHLGTNFTYFSRFQ